METKRGRPPKEAIERHTERLEIRFTPDEAKALQQSAKGRLATWARKVLLAAAKRKV
jgi:hypothetical protein